MLKTGQPLEWDWTGPDGRSYHIHDYPFTDTDGSPLIMEVGLDLTDHKRVEAELNRHREQLEALVRERTASLENEIAERKKAEETAERLARRNALLSQATGRLLSSAYPQAIVEDLCRQVIQFLDADLFINFLVDEAAGKLQLNAYAGISDEEAGRIFDPFFSTKPHGTGLGLSIARKIVEFMDGTIVLEETSDKGATFLVRLPRAEELMSSDQ